MLSGWILCGCLALAGGHPSARDISQGVDWLTRYGYLPPPDPYSAQQQTLDGLTKAVKNMQRFAGLKETGLLDDQTVIMMNRPRCSLPDISMTAAGRRRRRYALSGTVWQKKDLTWSVESFPIALEESTTRDLLKSALSVWSQETQLSFSEVRRGGDIRISFVGGAHMDGYPFDGPGGTLGHAFFPGVGPSAGETHMDADETWTYNREDGTDVFAVAVHEFGHALGLFHSSNEYSIMKPYYQGTLGDHRRYRLPPDDVMGIQLLYGRKTRKPGAAPPPPMPTRPMIPPQGPTHYPRPSFPDRCSTQFDAVAHIRGEVFFFKNRFFWRVLSNRQLVSLTPAHLGHFWQGLPPDLPKVDAVYERHNDSKIVFFSGDKYWVFKDTQVESGYPRPLADFGLREDGVDGAFVWKHNSKTYFFRGDRFWRFDERNGRMDSGYPQSSSVWKGLPRDLDDVTSIENGDTYFFKGSQFWKFQHSNTEAEPGYPRHTASNWMYCQAAAPPAPSEEPEGRGQKDCNCPCLKGNSARAQPVTAVMAVALAAVLSVVAST